MRPSDASVPTTSAGSASRKIVSLSAPVPHPMSSQRLPLGTASQARSSCATSRLQRPTYASYGEPLAQMLKGPPPPVRNRGARLGRESGSYPLVHLHPVLAAIGDRDAILAIDLDAHRPTEEALPRHDLGEALAQALRLRIDCYRADTPFRHRRVAEQRRQRGAIRLE